MTPAALEVWGDPIAHSLSPAMHTAAYRVLGLDWTYGRRQVGATDFDAELSAAPGRGVRRLSLTFPLKVRAFVASAHADRDADLTRAVNTLLLYPDGAVGANTDVGGLRDALADAGIRRVGVARVVGAGATARSAVVALAGLGAHSIEVVARRPEAVDALRPLAASLRITLTGRSFDGPFADVPVTVAALPGGAEVSDAAGDALAAAGGTLLDAVYGHWPTALAAAWQRAGRPAHDGRGMLLHQAVRQVRLFVGEDAEQPLEDEPAVVAAMRDALMGD